MNTKRLVTVAVLIALYTVLSLFSANLGLIKLTFESFPVLVASLMFGWVDGLLVGAVGGLLNQMLTYGFTVTTLMWILPNAMRGLLVYFTRCRRVPTELELAAAQEELDTFLDARLGGC